MVAKPTRILCLIASLATATAFAESTPAPAPEPKESTWLFNLTPRAWQKNPRVDMTVISELTPEGKKRPLATPQAPQYFALHSGGFIKKGDEPAGKPIPAAEIERLLLHSLAQNGFRPADDAHAPSLLIIYYWGMHGVLRSETAEAAPDLLVRNIFDRAALLGGDKFVGQLVEIARRAAGSADATARSLSHDPDGLDFGAGIGAIRMNVLADPMKQFIQSSKKNEFLIQQATDDIYFVIASAFDYQSIAQPKKQLLWRTRLTVGAQGVSQTEALPVLIATAAPYFGQDMAESAVLTKRTLREGTVDVGVPKVVEPSESK